MRTPYNLCIYHDVEADHLKELDWLKETLPRRTLVGLKQDLCSGAGDARVAVGRKRE